MRVLEITLSLLLFTVLTIGAASAQTARVRHHPDPSLSSSSPISALPTYSKADLAAMNQQGESAVLSNSGDVAQAKGDWETARSNYQDALNLWPDNTSALYGLAKCAENEGDTQAAIGYYRKVIYTHAPNVFGTVPGGGFGTNDVGRMMDFVLVLSQAHQDIEAQKVYKQAAHVLNYQDDQAHDGKPSLRVLLPEFGTGPGQIAYTPPRLQAMAHVAHSILQNGEATSLQEAQKALGLYPDSPVVNYYLGEALLIRDMTKAKAAYARAEQLGDAQLRATIEKRINPSRPINPSK